MIEKNWKELIKPSKLEVKQETNPEFTATIIAEPLERGYGVTLGNTLRRVHYHHFKVVQLLQFKFKVFYMSFLQYQV